MKKLGVLFFLLLILSMALSISQPSTKASHKKDVTFYTSSMMRMDSIICEETAGKVNLSLTPGIYEVGLKRDIGWFNVPILVNHNQKQTFYLFKPEDLFMNFNLSTEESFLMKGIYLSGIRFNKVGPSLVGKRYKILESKVIEGRRLSFHIANPIFNTSVENYILTVIEAENRYEKYMILPHGVVSFLKGIQTIAIEEENKKISLFESEWVAQNKESSDVVYRDGLKGIRSTTIRTKPTDSDLYIGNEYIGTTPYEIFLKEDVPVFIMIRKEGYFDQELRLMRDEMGAETHIELSRIQDGGVHF